MQAAVRAVVVAVAAVVEVVVAVVVEVEVVVADGTGPSVGLGLCQGHIKQRRRIPAIVTRAPSPLTR